MLSSAGGRPTAPRPGAPPRRARSARRAALAGANVALVSVPGEYATLEAHRALSRGLHVFLFSDHVSVEDEVALKRRGAERGLLVMGPGCGTAMLGGVGLGFANVVPRRIDRDRRGGGHRRAGGRVPRRPPRAAACRTSSASAGAT